MDTHIFQKEIEDLEVKCVEGSVDGALVKFV